jgi:hypothetical protein
MTSPDPNKDVVLTLDDISALGSGRRASRARARLEAARKSLRDKEQAKQALEAALRLSAPMKDDLSLAEEMSKCEGLMTRTGLKRVAATEGSVAGGNSSVVLSIPFTKTKKSETVNSKKGSAKKQSPSQPDSVQRAADLKNNNKAVPGIVKQEARGRVKSEPTAVEPQQSQTVNRLSPSLKEKNDIETPSSYQALLKRARGTCYVPCGCDNSPSSVFKFEGRGWEGTATLYHASRLRFGCLKFILSLAGRPGHEELIQALSAQSECDL